MLSMRNVAAALTVAVSLGFSAQAGAQEITGAGATFPAPAYTKWGEAFKQASGIGLNYQGIELGSNQNVSGMTHLHLDIWTANSTGLNVFLISPGPAEKPYKLTVPTSGWSSVDIPLSEFSPTVNLSNVFQFKFEGNGKIYLDNILFYK
jgi:hypothetical protein